VDAYKDNICCHYVTSSQIFVEKKHVPQRLASEVSEVVDFELTTKITNTSEVRLAGARPSLSRRSCMSYTEPQTVYENV